VNVSSRPGGRARPASSVHRALSRSFSSASSDGTDQSASGASTSARAAARCTRSIARNRDVAVTRSRSPGACAPSATTRFGSASTTREASRASGNRGFGASGARHPRGSPYSIQRSGSMSRHDGRDARCRRLERGRAASLCDLRRVQRAKGGGQRDPGRLDLGGSTRGRGVVPDRRLGSSLLDTVLRPSWRAGTRTALRAHGACPTPPRPPRQKRRDGGTRLG
jgi:hypothetical protein